MSFSTTAENVNGVSLLAGPRICGTVPEFIVVLPEVTIDSVKNAVRQLAESKFAALRPLPR